MRIDEDRDYPGLPIPGFFWSSETLDSVPRAAQVQHLCALLGYGADAVCPYLGIATLFALQQDGQVPASMSPQDIETKYTNVRPPPICICRDTK